MKCNVREMQSVHALYINPSHREGFFNFVFPKKRGNYWFWQVQTYACLEQMESSTDAFRRLVCARGVHQPIQIVKTEPKNRKNRKQKKTRKFLLDWIGFGIL